MKNQTAYDIVKTHLLKQKRQSKDVGGACVYRSEEGLKCAIGALLPDDLYDEKLEGEGVRSLLEASGKVQAHFEGVDEELLCELQYTHDEYEPSDWAVALEEIAHDFRLTP